ncbi:hypothetical protein AB0B45_41685 [Nonomuraea sp. NPDC049152]|uniref:hypothetical protein n=1 Tax=Nonomuraea sp. NPDC049152 TaxID=3154350 RepID=UPI0033C1B9A5
MRVNKMTWPMAVLALTTVLTLPRISDSGTQVFHPSQFGISSPQTAFGKILNH